MLGVIEIQSCLYFMAGSLPMLTLMLSSLSLDEYIPSTTRVFIKIRLLQA